MIENSCPIFKHNNQIKASYPNTIEGSKHFVMWSGGCDSTLLLYELLEVYGSDSVVAVSYVYPWLDKSKAESERLHRDLFKSKMRLKGSKFSDFIHKEISITETDIGTKIYINNTGLPQAVAWMLSVPFYLRDNDYIYDGGIKSDDLTCHLEQYHQLFNGVCGVLHRTASLREPYLYFNKRDVIERLIEYGIYDSTWYCEIPSNINFSCGKCVPCKTHISALRELADGLNDSSVYVKEFASRELQKLNTQKETKYVESVNITDDKKE